jgi:hypothetical protein
MKAIVLGAVSLLFVISTVQIFSVPPFAGDIADLYRSGYYSELDRGFDAVTLSFLSIKSMSGADYAWVYLADVRGELAIETSVFDSAGAHVPSPGTRGTSVDPEIAAMAGLGTKERRSFVSGSEYRSIVPVIYQPKCLLCHRKGTVGGVAGYMAFKRDSNPKIYYSAERAMIFTVISAFLGLLMFITFRWDPGRNLKDLFDKKS